MFPSRAPPRPPGAAPRRGDDHRRPLRRQGVRARAPPLSRPCKSGQPPAVGSAPVPRGEGHRLDARARPRRLGAGRARARQLRHALRAGLGARPRATGRCPTTTSRSRRRRTRSRRWPARSSRSSSARHGAPSRRHDRARLRLPRRARLGHLPPRRGVVRPRGRRPGRGDHPHPPAGARLRRPRLRRHPVPRARARRAARRDARPRAGAPVLALLGVAGLHPPRGLAVLAAPT